MTIYKYTVEISENKVFEFDFEERISPWENVSDLSD